MSWSPFKNSIHPLLAFLIACPIAWTFNGNLAWADPEPVNDALTGEDLQVIDGDLEATSEAVTGHGGTRMTCEIPAEEKPSPSDAAEAVPHQSHFRSDTACSSQYSATRPPEGFLKLVKEIAKNSAVCRKARDAIGAKALTDGMVCTVWGESSFDPFCKTGSHYSYWQMSYVPKTGHFTRGFEMAAESFGVPLGTPPNFNWNHIIQFGAIDYCVYLAKCKNMKDASNCSALIGVFEAVEMRKYKDCMKARGN